MSYLARAGGFSKYDIDERHSPLEKYTSHFIESVVCERELETEQNCNILTPPHSNGHNRVPFTFSWAAQPGAWGSNLSGTCSSIQHLISNWLIPNWLTSCLHPGYIMIWRPLFFLRASQSHSFNLSTGKVIIFWYSSTGCTCYLHMCISYFNSPAGSEVNIQHLYVAKKYLKLLWSAVNSKKHIKQRPGFYQISPYLADIILNENYIKIENRFFKISQKIHKNFLAKANIHFYSILLNYEFFLFLSSFLFRYSLIVNVFHETGYAWTPARSIPIISFPVFFSQKIPLSSHISLFLTNVNPSLSGQISDETWYTWWYLPMTIYPDGHIQNQ